MVWKKGGKKIVKNFIAWCLIILGILSMLTGIFGLFLINDAYISLDSLSIFGIGLVALTLGWYILKPKLFPFNVFN